MLRFRYLGHKIGKLVLYGVKNKKAHRNGGLFSVESEGFEPSTKNA